MRCLLLILLLTSVGCTINRAQHLDPDGKVDAQFYRSTLWVNAQASVSWDGVDHKFVFEYNQQSDATVKALQALTPLLKQAALAGKAAPTP